MSVDIPVYSGDFPHEALLDMDEQLIAEQLTLIEFDFYQRIEAPYDNTLQLFLTFDSL
jgi:hypothetical protein